jgi:DNA-binding winged helix-turn-helix (wHTH) protein
VDSKQLYNIETDTLIKLTPKDLGLMVKNAYVQQYFLNKDQFAILYFLCISCPHVVKYDDFKKVLEDIGLTYQGKKEFTKYMNNLKKVLKMYKVHDLIIKVGEFGYAISNKWVPPEFHTTSSRKLRSAKFIKLLEAIFPSN